MRPSRKRVAAQRKRTSKKSDGGIARKAGAKPEAVRIHPVTPERWSDLAALFGPRGACAGCWCMMWRQTQAEYAANRGGGNKRGLQRLVRNGPPPGLIAYVGDRPAGWCAIAPRGEYPRLDRSRVLARVDDEPVWSVTCFFIGREFRGRGLSLRLLRKAVEFATSGGAKIVEGYPVDPDGRYADSFAWVGLASAFEKAGFQEVARRSPTRPIMRIRCG